MNLITHTTDQITYFTFPDLPIRHAVLGRSGGVSARPFTSLNLSTSVPDEQTAVDENRRRAYGVLGRDVSTLVHANLVHRADVAVVDARDHGRVLAETDALITDQVGTGLTMNYADCAPILLYDPDRPALGLGHAGWAGTVRDVPGAMVRAMADQFGSRPENLVAAVGPCIGVDVYEVGQTVITAVREAFPAEADELLVPQPHGPRPHFNLAQANVVNLQRAGVRQILTAGTCTASRTDLFFSHRAEKGRTGRFGVVAVL